MNRAWVLLVLVACKPAPAPTPSSSPSPSPPASSSTSSASPALAAREPGTLSLDCGKATDAPIPEGSTRLPAPFVVERPDVDAILHHGTSSKVSEGWEVDPDTGCQHSYEVWFNGGGARARFEELARKLGVKMAIDEPKIRIYADAPKDGSPFFVLVQPVFGDDQVFVNVAHRGADVPACMQRAVAALQPSLRKTMALVESGAPVREAIVTRNEGFQPSCQVRFEWSSTDKKVEPKVRAWIESQGRKPPKRGDGIGRFAWDDGGEGFLTDSSVTFVTGKKEIGK